MIASVVPIVRIRRLTSAWSYKIPSGMKITPGALVWIPFRGRVIMGVVWEILTDDTQATESIQGVACSWPIFTQPSRGTIEEIARASLTSWSTVLYTWLPQELRTSKISKRTREILASLSDLPIQQTFPKQHLALVPDKRPEIIAELKKKHGDQCISTFDDYSLESWVDIATGKASVVIGRERGISAPYRNLRHVFLLEPEDIGFTPDQQPRMHYAQAATVLSKAWSAEATTRSLLPTKAAQMIWGEKTLGMAPQANVELVQREKGELITPALIQAIRTLPDGKQALILLNSHDRVFFDQTIGQETRLPGVESLRKKIAKELGYNELPTNIHVGTRSLFQHSYRNVGLTAVIMLEAFFGATTAQDLLDEWSDLGALLRYPAPCLLQTRAPHHPLAQALVQNRFEGWAIQELQQRQHVGMPPFHHGFSIAIPESSEGQQSVVSVQLELAALLEQAPQWNVSHPQQATVRGKSFLVIILTQAGESPLPVTAQRYLATLPRPWRIAPHTLSFW